MIENLANNRSAWGNRLWHDGRMKQAVEQFRLARHGYQKSIDLRPTRADMDPAWFFVSCPDPQFRDPAQAIRLAEMGRKQRPSDPYYPQMLGLAHYRLGNWQKAVAALDASGQLISAGNRATVLRPGWSMPFLGTLRYARFVLAMAHWQLSQQEQETEKAEQHQQTARQYFEQAVQEMQTPARGDAELHRFRAEAAELLGIPVPVVAPEPK